VKHLAIPEGHTMAMNLGELVSTAYKNVGQLARFFSWSHPNNNLTTVSNTLIFSLRYLGLLPVLNYNCTSMTVSFTTFTRQFHPRLLQNQRLSHIHHGSTSHLTRASRRCLARGHNSRTPQRASAMLGDGDVGETIGDSVYASE
jgi:hypothetical protein